MGSISKTEGYYWGCITNLQCCGNLSPEPHYPSITRYPKATTSASSPSPAAEWSEAKAVFRVAGMTCGACAGSVEKAIKRLPGIREAVVDVLNDKAQVLYYPSMVHVSSLSDWFLDQFYCKSLKKLLIINSNIEMLKLWSALPFLFVYVPEWTEEYSDNLFWNWNICYICMLVNLKRTDSSITCFSENEINQTVFSDIDVIAFLALEDSWRLIQDHPISFKSLDIELSRESMF